MKEAVKKVIKVLKNELKLAERCAAVRDNILGTITDKAIFSQSIANYFIDKKPPFPIVAEDPAQVALLKKILNALTHSGQLFERLEKIDPDKEWMVGIMVDVASVAWDGVNEVYAIFQTLNHSPVEIQAILGPEIAHLLNHCTALSKKLDELRPAQVGEASIQKFGEWVEMMPTEEHPEGQGVKRLSDAIFTLPRFFEQLHQWLASEESLVPSSPPIESDNHQEKMDKKAKDMTDNFMKIMRRNRFFSTPNMAAILIQLAKQSTALLSTGIPLTKEAYLKMVKMLDTIRHEIIPQVIAELERLEENLGLKPNLLVGPALEELSKYYAQLAKPLCAFGEAISETHIKYEEYANHWGAQLAKVMLSIPTAELGKKITPVANLDRLTDDGFKVAVHQQRVERLIEAEHDVRFHVKLQAATEFFNILRELQPGSSTGFGGNLSHIEPAEKEQLLLYYKHFQLDFAALHPELDEIIVKSLTQTPQSNWMEKMSEGIYREILSKNLFDQVLNTQALCMDRLTQSSMQAKLKVQHIQEGIEQREPERATSPAVFATGDHFHPMGVDNQKDLTDTSPEDLLEYHRKQAISAGIAQYGLESAKAALNNFTDHIMSWAPAEDSFVRDLPLEQRLELHNLYKKFQSYVKVFSPGGVEFDEALIKALSAEPGMASLRLSEIGTMMLEKLPKQLDVWIEESTVARAYHEEEGHNAKQRLLLSNPIEAVGESLEKGTLFGRIRLLNLSGQVASFLQTQVKPFLQESLDPAIFQRLHFDPEHLPLNVMLSDSEQVILYKNLINSIYGIHSSLSALEGMKDKRGPERFSSRFMFLLKFIKPIRELLAAKQSLTNLSKNPILERLLQQTLQIVESLQQLPMIGSYFQPTSQLLRPQEQALDMLSLWEQAQAQAQAQANQSIAMPTPPSPPEGEETSTSKDLIAQIAEQLYSLPNQIKALNPEYDKQNNKVDELDEKIQAFVDGLSNLSANHKTLKKILEITNIIHAQLSSITVESRNAVLASVRQMLSSFGVILLSTTDQTERELGFKPGVLSNPANNQFNSIYKALVMALPYESEQEKLDLTTRTTLLEGRIAAVQNRLSELETGKEVQEMALLIFGDPDKGILGSLLKLSHLPDEFTDEVMIEFFEHFTALQPYLAQINPLYDINSSDFLASLKTPDDFQRAHQTIITTMVQPLQSLVRAKQHSTEDEIRQCRAQLESLTNELKIQQAARDSVLEAYKETLLTNCLTAYFSDDLDTELGPLSELYRLQIQQAIEMVKEDLFADLTFDSDIAYEIENRFKRALNELFPEHIELKEAFAELNRMQTVLVSHLNRATVRNNNDPCRDAHIAFLQSELEALQANLLSVNLQATSPKTLNLKAQAVLHKSEQYEQLGELYDILDNLRVYRAQHKKAGDAKLEKIKELQEILRDTSKPPQIRLRDVIEQTRVSALSKVSMLQKFMPNSKDKLTIAFKSKLAVVKKSNLVDEHPPSLPKGISPSFRS